MKILLDYFFPIAAIEPTPAASTEFLKQVLAIVKPNAEDAVEDTITLCTTKSAVDAFTTSNDEVDQLFDAGMNRVFVLAVDDLTGLADILEGHESDFFTILISSDFSDEDIDDATDALDVGAFKGVLGISSTDDTRNALRAARANCSAFHTTSGNKAKNMFYAFGKLLSNSLDWLNQQYITMPTADDVATVGSANTLFDSKISFIIDDDEFGTRLALFAQGAKAIIAPYIKKNLEIDLQSKALQYISGNEPQYTKTAAALLEDELQQVVKSYIDRKWIENGTAEVKLEQDNFVASGYFNIAEPSALWRIFGEMRSTL